VGQEGLCKAQNLKVVQDLSLRLCARSELKKELEQLLLLLLAQTKQSCNKHTLFHRVKQMAAEIAILGGAVYQLCTHHLINISVHYD
jgi:hypothetical protein